MRVEVNESVVTCNCSHLTNFAILVVRISRMCVHSYADYSMLSLSKSNSHKSYIVTTDLECGLPTVCITITCTSS